DSRVLPDRRSVVRPREGRSREPEIFSYDEVIPSADERHEEVHRRIDQRPDSTGRAAARGASAARRRRLRRAVDIKEVLGPPWGLEEPSSYGMVPWRRAGVAAWQTHAPRWRAGAFRGGFGSLARHSSPDRTGSRLRRPLVLRRSAGI